MIRSIAINRNYLKGINEKKMVLIADSGSSKTDWVLTDGKNKKILFNTIGYNPYFLDAENIYNSISSTLAEKFNTSIVNKVFFYGAGCSNIGKVNIVHQALAKCFSNSKIQVGHDMLAAARALLGNQPGFVAIIGTGSNTCIYNGNKIEKNIDSLGYLLGDEGSGCHIGKKIVRDFMRGYLPASLDYGFRKTYLLKNEEIFDRMYNGSLPNRFLAGFCKFAHTHKNNPYVKKIVKECFNEFFDNLVCQYPVHKKLSFNCVGSVGFIFKEQLLNTAKSHGMTVGKIIASPITGLVDYHLKH